jgi:hypothetical protein
MPLPTTRHNYPKTPEAEANWDNFRLGLNTILRETELKKNELAQADNLMLTGSGVPTRRWGSANYFLAGATGSLRGLKGYYKTNGTNELLALTDWGMLTKMNGASYTKLAGASWSSGYDAQMVQLNDNMYIVNGIDTFKKYDGTTISSFATLSIPANVKATNLSGVSGSFTYSWRVGAENDVGETLASTGVTLANLPQDLTKTVVKIYWETATPTTEVSGYVVYGRDQGNETFLSRVPSSSYQYLDVGSDTPSTVSEPPTADSTGGPIAKYMIKYDNRLILGCMSDKKSRVMFSGKNQNSEKFHWSQGGGYIDVDVDGGDNITGLSIFQDKIIIFKERSIWQLTIGFITVGNWTIANPEVQAITTSHGAVSAKTIVAVENDVFFLTRNGVYVLGYEPNIMNSLRTNEVSARIRPFFDNISYSDMQNASAEYINKKYILSFPTAKKSFVYDRERTAWTGPWITPFGIRNWAVYYDSTGEEKWLAGDDGDTYVTEFNSGYSSDKGTSFTTILRTKKEDFGNWSMFKTLTDLFLNFRNVQGSVDISVRAEQKDGNVITVTNFAVTTTSTSAGWGADMWGGAQWADSEAHGSATDINDLVKWVILNKTARSIQLDIRTDNAGDSYELLGVRINAKPQGPGARPSRWKV